MNLFKRSVLAATAIMALASYPVYAVINSSVAVCNPAATTQCLKPDINGALPITGSFSATTTALTNTVAPTYGDGTTNPLSTDTSGQLRVTGTFSANSTAQATTAAPSYVNATPNPLSQDLSGNLRTITTLPTSSVVIGSVNSRNATAVTPADATANAGGTAIGVLSNGGTTALGFQSFPLEFNGTSWDRKRGDVNGSWTQGNVASGVADAGNPVKVGGIYTTSLPTLTSGQRGNMQIDINGQQLVNVGAALPAGSNIIGNVRIDQTTPGTTNGVQVNAALPAGANLIGSTTSRLGFAANGADALSNTNVLVGPYDQNAAARSGLGVIPFYFNGTTWDRVRGDATNGMLVNGVVSPGVTSGTSNFSAILAATTNSTNVKASAGVITEITVYNTSATVAWLKLYNAAAAPTCGTGTPVGRYLIPGSANGAGSNVDIALGKTFTTGISFCVTGLVADADATATAAATMTVNFTYK